MRPQKVQDLQMLNGLMSVFRAKGYDGASLSELATATGLKKASLYHRFPGGKKDMTSAVLTYLNDWVHQNIHEVLLSDQKNREQRLSDAIQGIKDVYKDGTEICLYRSLSLDSGIDLFGNQIRDGIKQWTEAFRLFGLEIGMTETVTIDNANQTFIEVQGSLVLSKTMNSTDYFLNTLEKIKERYT
jgi:AcrR family transcriptional regulator